MFPVIDDSTDLKPLKEKARGLNLRGRPRGAYVYGKAAEPFPHDLYVPKAAWPDWIADAERDKATPLHIMKGEGVKIKNQAQTIYCWIFSPTLCVEINRAKQNQKYVELSPTSAGARIKKFRNVGGWGKEAVEYLTENGLNEARDWPINSFDRKYDTSEAREAAKKYKVERWIELEPRNMEQPFSLILRGIAVSCGLNWWGHQVTYVWMTYDTKTKEFRPIIANSWGVDWGQDGFGELGGSRMYFDDGTAPIFSSVS